VVYAFASNLSALSVVGVVGVGVVAAGSLLPPHAVTTPDKHSAAATRTTLKDVFSFIIGLFFTSGF
jgi:hypothetical protein